MDSKNIKTFLEAPKVLTTQEVQHQIDQFQISQGYFSDIITAQTAIFSLIVAAIVALYFFFNQKTSKAYIKKEMDSYTKEIKEQSEKEFNEKMEKLQNNFSSGMAEHEKAIGRLTATNYRTLGQFWDSEKNYSTAFIWWFRGANQFAKVLDEKLARICLSGAKNALERIESRLDLQPDTIGEYQKLLSEIPDSYKIEKDLIDQVIKNILQKK